MGANNSSPDYGSVGDVEATSPVSANGNGSPGYGSTTSKSGSGALSHRNVDEGVVIRNETIEQLESSATMKEIDATIDLIIPMSAKGAKVIRQYHPHKWWLWKQWYGTVFQYGMRTALFYMFFAAVVCVILPYFDDPTNDDDPVDNGLDAFNQVWKYLLTLTTFIMTFFLNQSYNLWRQVYNLSRSVQGRTNDFGILLATHAVRDEKGEYTPKARKLLEDVAMGVRAFHAFVYASNTRIYRVLHTDRALQRMVERGVMTQEMMDSLTKLDVSPTSRVYVLIEWIIIQFRVGLEEGTLKGGAGFEGKYLEKALLLRSQYGTFGDVLDARIPLAYGHFVQVMVDTLLFCAPFACYKDMGMFSIATVGILSIFFAGLLDLSKVMLDPLDNEDYCDGVIDINVGVFIRESNSGSVRFYKGAEHLPSSWLK